MRVSGYVAIAVIATACSRPPRTSRLVTDPSWVADTGSFADTAPPLAKAPPSIAEPFREVATKIIAAARTDRGAYTKLAHLTDRIGHRLSGSAALDRAIAWAEQAFKDDGLLARREPVMVPHWVRGIEEASIVTPVVKPLRLLGLGGTVPTPKGGITAPVVVIRSWNELEARAGEVKGAIVLFDVALPKWTEKTSGYGEVAAFRTKGASRAAKLGAVGVLMRSVTAHSLQTPHTGSVSYDPALPRIPAAAISVEDSQLIARLVESSAVAVGTANPNRVTVKLRLESQQLPDAPSANVIGELRGRELPDEIVILAAHLDSWDVGQGAHDDGAGCVTMMHALATLKRLGLQPRRTIRVVLYTNEENGLRGGKQYAIDHAAELSKTVLAVEADGGGYAPRGFTVETKPEEAGPRVQAKIAAIAELLAPLGVKPSTVILGHSGADISPLIPAGVPGLGFITANEKYFDIHHTEADTLDKVDPQELADGVAALAVLAYVVAEMPGRPVD